jgi:hypothetical protein
VNGHRSLFDLVFSKFDLEPECQVFAGLYEILRTLTPFGDSIELLPNMDVEAVVSSICKLRG